MLLVGIPAGISTWQIGRARQLSKGVLALLVGGPIFDSIIAFWLFELVWNFRSNLVGWCVVHWHNQSYASATIVSSSTTDYVALAKENILRRKRQAALLMAGLVIASAIISSSLVVGDSLDATITNEVEGSWGETDITLSGFDFSTGERVVIDERVATNLWSEIGIR